MAIELSPALEARIHRRIESGAFSSAEEVISRALDLLHDDEDWLLNSSPEIQEQIQEGWEQTRRGEGLDAEAVKAEMQRYIMEWKQQQNLARTDGDD